MSADWARLAAWLGADGTAALVTIAAIRGSSPREAGTRMLVRRDGRIAGTIGGGTLEWQAIALAQSLMAKHPEGHGLTRGFALGPDMGQCCGGHVTLRIEALAAADAAWIAPLAAAGPAPLAGLPDGRGVLVRQPATATPPAGAAAIIEPANEQTEPLLLFGAGHVGRALVLALAPLPFAVRWVDTRAALFPAHAPANVVSVATAEPVAEIEQAAPGTPVLVMTHSHALDFDLVAAGLSRPDLAEIGVIGSATKRARFISRLRGLGLGAAADLRLACPIGMPALGSKHPAVIAAGIAVTLLQQRAKRLQTEARPALRAAHPA